MAIDLLKKKVGIILTKRKLEKVVCEVKVAFDLSGSMESLYQNGTVQNLADRILAVATKFDDNGELEAWTFSCGYDQIPVITEQKHEDYVNQYIVKNSYIKHKWGGTEFLPVMQDIISEYTHEDIVEQKIAEVKAPFWKRLIGQQTSQEIVDVKKTVARSAEHPAFVVFQTDGENSDKSQVERLLESSKHLKIYWQFICVGNSGFEWVEKMSKKFGNVGFQKFSDLKSVSDEQFYEKLIDESFAKWITSIS